MVFVAYLEIIKLINIVLINMTKHYYLRQRTVTVDEVGCAKSSILQFLLLVLTKNKIYYLNDYNILNNIIFDFASP